MRSTEPAPAQTKRAWIVGGGSVGGTLLGSLCGATIGILAGGAIGMAAFTPSHPADDPLGVLGIFDACFGFMGMLIGALIGGVVATIGGAVLGAMLGAGAAGAATKGKAGKLGAQSALSSESQDGASPDPDHSASDKDDGNSEGIYQRR
jgi:hypothetical protein